MNLVHEIRRMAHAHEWTASVNVLLPSVHFVVVFKGQEHASVACFDDETEWFQIDAFNVGDVA